MAEGSAYNGELADLAVSFIGCLKHTKGEWYGQNFELIDWQEQIIRDLFGIVKPNGYRSYHMIIDIEAPYEDVEGNNPGHFFAEIQLRTIAMDSWASLEHQMKYKHDIKNPEMIVRELKRCADELAACDLSMQTIRNLIHADH